MGERIICHRECFVYNKRFKKGDEFPEKWLLEGYLPNNHFAPEEEAKRMISASETNRPVQCAGDDPRSTKDIKSALLRYMKSVPEKWSRKELWNELRRHEMADAKTEQSSK